MQKSAGIGNLTRVAVDQKASPFWISAILAQLNSIGWRPNSTKVRGTSFARSEMIRLSSDCPLRARHLQPVVQPPERPVFLDQAPHLEMASFSRGLWFDRGAPIRLPSRIIGVSKSRQLNSESAITIPMHVNRIGSST